MKWLCYASEWVSECALCSIVVYAHSAIVCSLVSRRCLLYSLVYFASSTVQISLSLSLPAHSQSVSIAQNMILHSCWKRVSNAPHFEWANEWVSFGVPPPPPSCVYVIHVDIIVCRSEVACRVIDTRLNQFFFVICFQSASNFEPCPLCIYRIVRISIDACEQNVFSLRCGPN